MQYVHLFVNSLKIKLNSPLNQFDVTSSSVKIVNKTMVTVELRFQRKIIYHLSNTYLPTISLLVIVKMAIFFDESKQEVAVSLTLTVLLVIYTFYQGISQTIPRTEYMKLIDYWLMYCLLDPFIIFIIQCIWYLDSMRGVNRDSIKIGKTNVKWIPNKSTKISFLPQKRVVKFVIISFTVLTTFCYFAVAIYVYNFQNIVEN